VSGERRGPSEPQPIVRRTASAALQVNDPRMAAFLS
jgi:hypothetical protein